MASSQEILQTALQSGDEELLELALKMQTNQEQTTDAGITSGLTETQKTAFDEIDFTGKTEAGDRFQKAVTAIGAVFPIQEQEYYQERAEAMYPEADYAKDKFWNDISLGLSLISGRSEGGRWAPIMEEGLNKWLEGGAPIREAERARGAQIATSAAEMRQADVDNFQDMMGQYMIADMTAQLGKLDQYRVLTDAEAIDMGLDTDRGQIWRINDANGKVEQLQGTIPRDDKFKILSTKEAAAYGFATEQGQVYIMNEKDGKPVLFQGAQVGLNFEILSPEEAKGLGLVVDDGQLWQRDTVTGETSQLFGITQRPQNFTVLSSTRADTLGLPVDEGQVWQRNNTTGAITELQGRILPTDDWVVMSAEEASKLPTPLPTDSGEVWIRNKKDGSIKPLLTPASASEREKKIAALYDILKSNKWGATEDDQGLEVLPDDKDVMRHATKLVDGVIDLVQQEDGRLYQVDESTGDMIYLNATERGEFPLIGFINPENPYAKYHDPLDFGITDLTTIEYSDSIRQIRNLSYALVEGENLQAMLENVLGPQNFFKDLSTNTMAILPSGIDAWAKWIKTTVGQQAVELYGRVLIQALALNPRYPVAEQEMINKLNSEGVAFFLDKEVGLERFMETQRFLKNRLAFNRSGLQQKGDKQGWYTIESVPSGTKAYPFVIDPRPEAKFNTKDEDYMIFLANQGIDMSGVWVKHIGTEEMHKTKDAVLD